MPKYKGPSYNDALAVVREQITHLSARGGTMTPNAALEAIGDKFSRDVTWREVEGRYLAKYLTLSTVRLGMCRGGDNEHAR